MSKTLRRILKIIGYTILFFIGFILLYLGSAYILSRITVNGNANSKKEVQIYILSNGVHTDIVTPIKTNYIDWSKTIKFEHTQSKDSIMQYVAFGWGDKGFYLETPTWADLTFRVAFKTAFYLGSSAMHTTFYKTMYEGGDCKKIDISNEEYRALVSYIQQSFQVDSNGNVIYIKATTYDKDDAFYEAKRVYGLFFTCNTWANNALKACNQKACLWTAFQDGIFYQYKN